MQLLNVTVALIQFYLSNIDTKLIISPIIWRSKESRKHFALEIFKFYANFNICLNWNWNENENENNRIRAFSLAEYLLVKIRIQKEQSIMHFLAIDILIEDIRLLWKNSISN